jgi:hypothetical protein
MQASLFSSSQVRISALLLEVMLILKDALQSVGVMLSLENSEMRLHYTLGL